MPRFIVGHGLQHEGAPHDTAGRSMARYQGRKGRAKCRCGTLSDVLSSNGARKRWHREHKAAVIVATLEVEAATFNATYPLWTPVTFWPGLREGPGRDSITTTPAWVMGGHTVMVTVRDYSGGIILSHIEQKEASDGR